MVDYFKRGVKGSAIILLFTISANLFGYFARAFLARILPLEDFGLFYAVFTFFMFLSILTNLGYGQALVKFVPEFLAKKQKHDAEKTFFHVFLVRIIISVAIASVVALFAGPLAIVYFKTPLAVGVILLFSVFLVLNNIESGINLSFQALQDMLDYGLSYFFSKFLFFLLVVSMFFLGLSTTAVLPALACLAASAVTIVAFGAVLYKKIKPKKVWTDFDRPLFSRLTAFAFPSLLTEASGLIIGYIDTILITIFLTLDQVGVYNATLPTVLLIGYAATAMTTVLFPMASEIWAKNEKGRLSAVGSLYTYAIFVTLPFAVLMLIYPKTILDVLFGPDYVAGFIAMRLLAVGVIFIGLARINFSVLSGIGRPKEVTKIMLAAAVFNTILNVLLIPSLGIAGAALTTTMSYFIMMILSYLRISKFIEFKLPSHQLLKLLLVSLALVCSLVVFTEFLPFSARINMIAGAVFSLLIYLFLVFSSKILDWKQFSRLLKKS